MGSPNNIRKLAAFVILLAPISVVLAKVEAKVTRIPPLATTTFSPAKVCIEKKDANGQIKRSFKEEQETWPCHPKNAYTCQQLGLLPQDKRQCEQCCRRMPRSTTSTQGKGGSTRTSSDSMRTSSKPNSGKHHSNIYILEIALCSIFGGLAFWGTAFFIFWIKKSQKKLDKFGVEETGNEGIDGKRNERLEYAGTGNSHHSFLQDDEGQWV